MKYFAAILLSLLGAAAAAQPQKWNLEQCISYALENNIQVDIQKAQTRIDKYSYQQAIAELLPTINAGSEAYFNFGRGIDPETNTFTDVNSFSNSYSLTSSLNLFSGLRAVNEVRLQKFNSLMNRQQLNKMNDMLAFSTMEAFFNVQHNKNRLKLAEQQLLQSKQNLKQAERMMELGLKGAPDVAEFQAKAAADEYNLTRSKNLLTISLIQLKEQLSYPINEELDIEDHISNTSISKATLSAQSIYERCLAQLPEALAAQYAFRVKQVEHKQAIGSLAPTLSAHAGYSTGFSRFMDGSSYISFSNQLANKRRYYIGASLSIPIFNGLSRTSSVRRSKQQLYIAERQKDETLRKLYSEIEQAVADMNGQADEYKQAKKQAEAMMLAHSVNERRYREGLASAIDLTTSANRLFSAQIEEVNALLKFYLKQKLVSYYSGELQFAPASEK